MAQAVYGLVGAPAAGPAAQAPAAEGYVFAPADIISPYAMTWDAYSEKLKPYLLTRLRPSAPSRAAPAPAQEQAAPAGDRGSTIRNIKAFIKSNNPDGVRPPPADGINGWSNGSIDRLVDAAAAALPADPPGIPFNSANFLNSIRPLMSDQARQNQARGVGKNGIVVNPTFPFANIGV